MVGLGNEHRPAVILFQQSTTEVRNTIGLCLTAPQKSINKPPDSQESIAVIAVCNLTGVDHGLTAFLTVFLEYWRLHELERNSPFFRYQYLPLSLGLWDLPWHYYYWRFSVLCVWWLAYVVSPYSVQTELLTTALGIEPSNLRFLRQETHELYNSSCALRVPRDPMTVHPIFGCLTIGLPILPVPLEPWRAGRHRYHVT